MDKTLQISLKCLFCNQTLKGDVEQSYKLTSGDLITCSECGELNDYDSVLEIAKKTGIEQLKKNVLDDLRNSFRKKR
ncbi:hypothetical protein [Wohlfahrtiimonas chitiniclastica]|uniref:hypothetical protein n=1 Tax=Wohlfahrtiimonas chitiniclastica TaxID=400946 RepID=UPI000B988AD7|nr:hypothetical protein [Wohlfahrtiimonas chitiniclastica]OYQ75964.1 hypothetical protein B9T18_00995 [Wohlfahrtiimonas chitiniclastica]